MPARVATMADSLNYYRKLIRARGFTGEEAETLVQRVALIAEKGWTQIETAKKLGVQQPRIAELNRIGVDKFSTDLLVKYLYRLKRLVHVTVVDAPQKRKTY
jgi:predicted XRE-type DNA-binding protein